MSDIDSKLELILLKMANEIISLPSSDMTLGQPIDNAKKSIYELFDNEIKNAVYSILGPKDE